ncbi:MAG TPA: penicillin-binding protein 2 [Nitrospirae bacterium]|nr:penicillin-binding protein 2 [Nitrospirota bacterium]
MRKNRRKARGAAPAKKVNAKLKTMAVAAILFLGFGAITVRLAQLTMFSDERVAEFSAKQRFRSIKLHMPRGMIFDRNMNELAVSVKLRSVYANPRRIDDPRSTARALAKNIEPKSHSRQNRLYTKLVKKIKASKDKYFIWVKRKVSPETYARIRKEKIRGVGFVKESKRFYPKRDIAAKLIGFCGIDNQGLYGLEYYYDDVIHPVDSRSIVRKDALGRPISTPGALSLPNVTAPYDLVLTIDERVQYITEKALERQTLASRAKGGVAIVMNPNTGEILAMAEQPKFNPNNYQRYKSGSWKSQAVSQAFEPGSTFKVFVAAAALEEKEAAPTEIINCENGRYTVGGKTFREALNHRYKMLTVTDVIAKSSNIGAIKIAERLGPRRLKYYLSQFGFGARTNVDLPGESAGLLRGTKAWSRTSLPSISFGQEVAVTPIQLATGISVLANGGYLVQPRLAKALMRGGKVIRKIETKVVRKILSESTVKSITNMMTQVVESGTGRMASVPGFTVAGKTGTAQKIDPATGSYSDDKFLSSFVGFFPAEKPRLVIIVMIDEPEGVVWGGAVAGPVFAEIASRSARILRIPGSETEIYEINWAKMLRRDNLAKDADKPGRIEKKLTGDTMENRDVYERFISVIESVKQII